MSRKEKYILLKDPNYHLQSVVIMMQTQYIVFPGIDAWAFISFRTLGPGRLNEAGAYSKPVYFVYCQSSTA